MISAQGPFSDAEIRNAIAGNEIGGGAGYINQLAAEKTPTREWADYIVEQGDTPRDLFDGTNDYEKVWVDGAVDMDLTGWSGAISNCTLASDRGQNGSEGARLYTTDHGEDSPAWGGGGGTGFLRFHDDVRFFGMRLRGPTWDYWKDDNGDPHPEHPGYIPFHFDTMDADERDAFRRSLYSRGISVYGENVEIENCEIHGFSTHGISVGTHGTSTTYKPDIHHCDIHNCMQSGLGYLVNTYRGIPRIRYCYLNASRHTLATFGWWNSGYHLEDSVIGPATSLFLLDSHYLGENGAGSSSNRYNRDFYGRAGGYNRIRRNTFVATHVIKEADFNAGNRTRHVSWGGESWPVDGDGVIIESNEFAHDTFSRAIYQNTSGSNWSVPTGSDGTTANFIHRDNMYDFANKSYDLDYGAPVNLRDTTPEHTLSFRITDAADGSAIEGAEITATHDGSEWYRITDADGLASMSPLPAATYSVSISAGGYESLTDTVTVNSDTTRDYSMIPVEDTIDLTITLTDATSGDPIQGADVSVWEF